MNIKPSKGYQAFRVINTIVMIVVVCITLYPFIYLIAQSFSSDTAVAAGKVTFFPVDFTTATYKYLLRDNKFFLYYGNTIIYSVVGTAISVAGTALLAYPLSKDKLRLNKFFTPFVVFTMYFTGGLIPNYILVTQWLHLGNTIWAVVLPGAISTFNLLLMKSFFAGLPDELEEAAAIDGLGVYGSFIKIIIPLSKPILATMVLFYLVGMWNEWFGPFLYLEDDAMKPISLWVRQLVEGANSVEMGSTAEASSVQATLKSATMVLTSLPIICVYP
ncbi:carbohydrate ABC transporter permease, partial [Blautia pseudococcoides]|nr:carbohydrate ABC transporter permease [Blautia pseudococcoides]